MTVSALARMLATAVVGALIASACAPDAARPSPGSTLAPSETTEAPTTPIAPIASSPPTTPATLADERLGLSPITDEVAGLPEAWETHGPCGWVEDAWPGALTGEVFTGRPRRVGDRGMTTNVLGRVLEVEVVEVHADPSGQLEPGTTVPVLVADTEFASGYRVELPAPDLDAVMERDLVVVFGRRVERFVRLERIIATIDGAPSFHGFCQGDADVLAEIADRLGDADVLAMLVRLAEAGTNGLAEMRDAFVQWRADMEAASAPPPWHEQDPATRVLGPMTVPADLRQSLDVFGASYALDDLDPFASIGARTESGVTSPLVGGPTLPLVWPVFVLRGIDTMVEVFVQTAGVEPEVEVIGTVSLADVDAAGGGIEVTGSVRDGTVTIETLSREEIAERLGIDADQLDARRQTVLDTWS